MVISIGEPGKEITSPQHVFEILRIFLNSQDEIDRDKEHFFVIHLNSRNKIKLIEVVSIGTLNSSMVHPREVFTRVIAIRTASILVAHNHPSGDIEPSKDDIEITRRLQEAGSILGIELMDHVIVGNDKFLSFKEHDLI